MKYSKTALTALIATGAAYGTAGMAIIPAVITGALTGVFANIAGNFGNRLGRAIGLHKAGVSMRDYQLSIAAEQLYGDKLLITNKQDNTIWLSRTIGGATLGLVGIFGGYALGNALVGDMGKETNDTNTEVSQQIETNIQSGLASYAQDKNGHYVLPAKKSPALNA